MDVQEVKISEFTDLSSDLRMVLIKDKKPILDETKLTKHENIELSKKFKTIINSGLEVEETIAKK